MTLTYSFLRLSLALILCSSISVLAYAQEVDLGFGGKPIYIEADEFEDDRKLDKWAGQLGFGVSVAPRFLGASDHILSGGFDLKVSYADRFFLENNRIGAVLYRSRLLRAGIIGRWNLGRRDTQALRVSNGLEQVEDAFEIGGFAATSLYKLFLTTEFYFGASDVHRGATVELEAGYTFEPNSNLRMTPIIGTSWGSGKFLNAFFGVPVGNANFEAFEASSGVFETYGELALEQRLSKNWLLKGSLRYALYTGSASNSPIVRSDIGSRHQFGTFLGIVWLF